MKKQYTSYELFFCTRECVSTATCMDKLHGGKELPVRKRKNCQLKNRNKKVDRL